MLKKSFIEQKRSSKIIQELLQADKASANLSLATPNLGRIEVAHWQSVSDLCTEAHL